MAILQFSKCINEFSVFSQTKTNEALSLGRLYDRVFLPTGYQQEVGTVSCTSIYTIDICSRLVDLNYTYKYTIYKSMKMYFSFLVCVCPVRY